MALDQQIHTYSIDTGHLYSNHEASLHWKNHRFRSERSYLINRTALLENSLLHSGYTANDLKFFIAGRIEEMNILPHSRHRLYEYMKYSKLIKHKSSRAAYTKSRLLSLLKNKTGQNIITGGKDHIREIRPGSLKNSDVISIFSSSTVRTLKIETGTLTDQLITLQIYYFELFRDVEHFGFIFNGEKYIYLTSSAGQIRQKKAVFIKESSWLANERTFMCGLTVGKINSKGGNNVNKHLSYLALNNSATDPWQEFDIDRAIVIDDFETEVSGTYDFIDDTDYSINRKTGYVPITHTDGSGMWLPKVMKVNSMFRAPWIKGLMAVFDFREMIRVNGYSPVIKDIYGHEHDIVTEDIQIIFTKSQFKMWNYYDSWDDYKNCFKTFGCTAGLCNTEEPRIKPAKINYQMLQTLTDITEDEMSQLTQKSVDRITNLCSSPESMQEALGITPYNQNMTPLQEAVKMYPNLINDTYVKDILRSIKDSLVKKYRSGKIEVNGKYTFILPDFYAACEYWFGGQSNPRGLLADQEVFCWLFRRYEKIDCLRSPHLYKEHAVRKNTAYSGERREKLRYWFCTNAIYTSCYDLISKILQFDDLNVEPAGNSGI